MIDHDALLARIRRAVDARAYRTPTARVDPAQQPAMDAIREEMAAQPFDAARVRHVVRRLHDEGRIDRVHMLSALHVVAAHPAVKDYAEAARLAGEQEQAALEQGGPRLDTHLASVDRHRGVLAFLTGHHAVALDHFTRAFERERTAENASNVLATLLRLGDLDEAERIHASLLAAFPDHVRADLETAIDNDPDLAALRPPLN